MSSRGGGGGCSEEEEEESLEGTTNEDDEYHEDGLPDLVLEHVPPQAAGGGGGDARLYSESSQNSGSLSSLDLLTLVGSQGRLNIGSGGGSASDLLLLAGSEDHYNEAEYSPNGANEEILTEVSNRGVFKVSYVDHSKAYVAKVSGSEKYRSYLSLMPEDIPSSEAAGEPEEEEEGRKQQILSEFKALSYEDQIGQRITWAKELEKTESEILELKERLAFKTAWCGVLRRNLGISRWKKLSTTSLELSKKVVQLTEKTADNFQTALEATEQKILASQSLQKAKDSFEILSNEVKDRVKQGRDEIAKKVSQIRIVEEEEEEEEKEEAKGNSKDESDAVLDGNCNSKGECSGSSPPPPKEKCTSS